jgi:hypothetical protein
MNPTMRAKLQVQSVTSYGDPPTSESLSLSAVTGNAGYGPKGESEDNTFARYTPSATFSASIKQPRAAREVQGGSEVLLRLICALTEHRPKAWGAGSTGRSMATSTMAVLTVSGAERLSMGASGLDAGLRCLRLIFLG